MVRRYVPVKVVALVATGFMLTGLALTGLGLTGAGTAVAAPNSHSDKAGDKKAGDKGGGKPSTSASGNSAGGNGSGHGKPTTQGNSPGASKSAPNGGPNNGGPNNGGPNIGPKSLPDAASQIAGTATGQMQPATTDTPNSFGKSVAAAANSFGKSVAAAASGQQGQGIDIKSLIPTALQAAIPTAVPPVTVTVPVDVAATLIAAQSARIHDRDAGTAGSRGDRNDAVPPTARAPHSDLTVTVAPEASPRPDAAEVPPSSAASAAAAISVPQSPSTPATVGTSPENATERSWLGRVANQVVDEIRESLREVTLQELALAALPGLAGILFFFTTGIGLGHRQAKFGFALKSTGALRFAIRGPLGVVRPDGFISVPARTGKRTRLGGALLDRAA